MAAPDNTPAVPNAVDLAPEALLESAFGND
jgi:hypothetical protein